MSSLICCQDQPDEVPRRGFQHVPEGTCPHLHLHPLLPSLELSISHPASGQSHGGGGGFSSPAFRFSILHLAPPTRLEQRHLRAQLAAQTQQSSSGCPRGTHTAEQLEGSASLLPFINEAQQLHLPPSSFGAEDAACLEG